jgi:hypothetical protein
MSEEQILAERAEIYARLSELPMTGESRCLQCWLGDRRWLLPESQVRLLLPGLAVTELPPGASWNGWPCAGLVCHGQATYPLISWANLLGAREPGAERESALLLLREVPVVMRVPGPLEMIGALLEEAQPDSHVWSAGKVPGGASVARLERLGGSRP